MSAPEVTPEIEGKYRQFVRALMSYVDFQQASGIARVILDSDLIERYPEERFHLQGLNAGMIVAYWRPFTYERSSELSIPPLPERFLQALTSEERELHRVIEDDRNRVMAHSDSDAWNPQPHYMILSGQKMLIPQFSNPHAHLLRPSVERIEAMCEKLREACFEERNRLEQELEQYLPVVEPDMDELRKMAEEMGVHLPE